MELNRKSLKRFIQDGRDIQTSAKKYCEDVLRKIDCPIEFDWNENNAPSISSISFCEDQTDAYIEMIWFDHGLIKVNLYAYYLGERRDNVELSSECNTDYLDVLDYLVDDIYETMRYYVDYRTKDGDLSHCWVDAESKEDAETQVFREYLDVDYIISIHN